MLRVDKQDIFMTKRDTAYLQYIPQILNEETKQFEDYELEEGDRVVFRLKGTKRILEKDLQIELETNTAMLALVPDDTADFDIRTYYYEVELITSREEHFTFIANRRFTIEKEIETDGN